MEFGNGKSSDLFLCSKEQRKAILDEYKIDEATLKEKIEIIKSWMKQQAHLPEITCDERIERFFLMNVCDVDKTKKKLDMYYTIRSMAPEIFNDNFEEDMKKITTTFHYLPLPKLTDDLRRVIVIKIFGDVDNFDVISVFRHILNVAEVRLFEDYNTGEICILCMEEMKWTHCAKMPLATLLKLKFTLEKMVKTKIKQMHYVNAPPFFQTFFSLFRPVIKKKFLQKDGVIVHENIESLQQHFSKDILPSDFGGNEKSLAELSEILNRKLHDYKPWFDRLKTLKVDERLRKGEPSSNGDDDISGCYGNFRKLDID